MATVVPPAPAGARLSALGDRQFKSLLVWPAVLVLLLIGLFPIIYTLMVSFQNINMFDEDT
jgi:multiple sugar transport system permease protein